MVVD
jgi:hypothetical protein